MCQGLNWDKLIPPLTGNPYNGYINPYQLYQQYHLTVGHVLFSLTSNDNTEASPGPTPQVAVTAGGDGG